MQLTKTKLSGVYIATPTITQDDRGFFGRMWDPEIAKAHGLLPHFNYTCVSGNTKKHTLRGMHYQKDPHGETKLVRCTKGSMFDVVVDLRPTSKTFRQWVGAELSAGNYKALYIPTGCAHGFLTLTDDTEVLYDIAGVYTPEASIGVRFNDSAFNIDWPASLAVIAPRDALYPDFA